VERKLPNARILVVEDNPTNQKVIVLRLEKLGCVVEVANNGLEAVHAAGITAFDVILMDCQMPVLDGFEATSRIRTESKRHTPIIALTANAMDGERERCLHAGMDDYLSKPVRADELLKKLEHWIGVKAGAAPLANAEKTTESDIREGLEHFIASMQEEGIERDEIDALFGSFLETSTILVENLQTALKKHDEHLLESAAHALRGNFANFGLRVLTELSLELEQAGKNHCFEKVPETLRLVLSAYKDARKIIARMITVPAK
jgi:CheY-like chemotaxis protein